MDARRLSEMQVERYEYRIRGRSVRARIQFQPRPNLGISTPLLYVANCLSPHVDVCTTVRSDPLNISDLTWRLEADQSNCLFNLLSIRLVGSVVALEESMKMPSVALRIIANR